ncbi:MAG: hypothetical protein LV481_01345 [Methylacidiphilales bacterium]|nr:hypothetical protein [Candidatus Methylacidiphilales bacterium]
MLETVIAGLKSMIDLRKKARDDKKIGLEIKALERETQQAERLITPATIADVERYDPKVKKLKDDFSAQFSPKADYQPPRSRPPIIFYTVFDVVFRLLFLLFVLFALYGLARLVSHFL